MKNWWHEVRLRALWVVVAIAAMAVAIITTTALPALPVLGVAFATVALVLNTLTSKVSESVCLSCGHDLKKQPRSAYGCICPSCGSIHEGLIARSDTDDSLANADDAAQRESTPESNRTT